MYAFLYYFIYIFIYVCIFRIYVLYIFFLDFFFIQLLVWYIKTKNEEFSMGGRHCAVLSSRENWHTLESS